MAVAGLHNVSAFGPSFFGESQSPVTRRWVDERGRPSTRASTLLQMWRDLEGEHAVVSQPTTSVGQGSDNGDDICQSSDESLDQGFTGSETDHDDNNSVISEQSSDLGEIERERVRQIIREWMNSGSKGHSSYGFHRNKRSGQWLGENERERVRIIREWVQMTTQQRSNCGSLRNGVSEVGSQIEQVRDGLVITRSDIGSRRPIRRLCGRQTLLDLLLRAQSERKRELQDLLEQRPVSDFAHRNRIQAFLRGRFLRNERLVMDERPSSMAATELGLLRQRHTVSGLREGFLSRSDSSASTSAISAESGPSSDENNGESKSTCRVREVTGILTTSDLENATDGNRSPQELELQVTELQVPILDNEGNEQEISGSATIRDGPSLDTEARQDEQINVVTTNESLLESEDINHSGSLERSDASYVHEVDDGNTNEESSAHVEESQEPVFEIEDTATQWFRETSDDNNVEEQDQMADSHEDWPSHDLQEAIDSWLDLPSEEVGVRIDTFYLPDDDNVHSMELRELVSRRRVSSLLRSSFRESLDQVLQSHVERLGHASGDWELDNTSSSPGLIEQEQEQLNDDQTFARSNGAERNPFAPSSNLFPATQPLWDEDFQGANWLHHNSNQQLGTDWEVINELRLDMARLHQRLNNMQNMLEACMDMQIELQRSVRQEVSAALNRPIFSRDESQNNHPNDESKWDHVRKGICCLCRDSKIDSLLYRCGHMCTCSKCAENLVQYMGKCPMCRAPVVEAVRAYLIQ